MLGILNEKGDQAAAFGKILGGKQIPGMPRNFYHGTYDGEEFVIAHGSGHVYKYKDPDQLVNKALANRYKSWDPKLLPWNYQDFNFSYEPIKKKAFLIKPIKETLGQCDEIAIATDDDPSGEGEKLAWEIIDNCHLHPQKFSRMYFTNDHGVKDVTDAFKKRVPKKDMMSDPDMIEAIFRAHWDFLSMQWTRIASSVIGFAAILYNGRLKTSMTVIVKKQFEKIKNYKKIPTYSERFKDENGNVFTKRSVQTYPNKEDVKLDAPAAVKIDSVKLKYQAPPKMFDLTQLDEVLGSKIKSKILLDTYQNMYNDHVVTYPRTENHVITPTQFEELVKNAPKIAKLVGIDPKLLTHLTPRKNQVADVEHIKGKDVAVTHGANRPWDNLPDSLDGLDEKYGQGAKLIFITLAKGALATLGEDYLYEQTSAHVDGHDDYTCKINTPKDDGYKKILGNLADKTTNLSKFGQTAKPFIFTGYPPKPVKPTKSWLYKQLDKYNVGTPSTQVNTFANISDGTLTEYPIFKETRGKISFTKYGDWSAIIMEGTKLADLNTTNEINSRMFDLREGKATFADAQNWLNEVADLVVNDRVIMENNAKILRSQVDLPTVNNSPKVSGQWTDDKGQTFDINIKTVWRGHTWTKQEIADLFAGKEFPVDLLSKNQTKYTMLVKLDHRKMRDGRKVVKGIWVDGRFPEAKKRADGFPAVYFGHEFTDEEVNSLKNKKPLKLFNLKSRSGSFNALILWDAKNKKIKAARF